MKFHKRGLLRPSGPEIFHYIEVWYNRKRRHSTLGYLRPVELERRKAAEIELKKAVSA